MARSRNSLAVTGPLVKSSIFAVFGFLVLGILWIQFGQIRFTEQKTYSAVFTSATGMREASAVTVNGVAVGRVDKVELVNNNQAEATFSIDGYVPLTQATQARIRYKNLTGDQYLDLTPGPGSDTAPPLAEDGVLPVTNTTPSLDIDALLSGFNPLLQGLQPEQVNQVSAELVTVLQGQGGTINQVLEHVASFSGSLADQDKVIGSAITNLNKVLGNLDAHSTGLNDTIRGAQEIVSKLNADRRPLLDGLDRTEKLAGQVGDIAKALRTGHDTFRELGRASGRFNDIGQEFDRVLRTMPGAYLRLGRLSVTGGHYQLNLCAVRLRMTGPDGEPFDLPQVGPSDNSARCTRDNISPLQGGDAAIGPHGPQLPQTPWDGQQVTAGTRGQEKPGTGFVPPHQNSTGNGR